MLLQFPGPACYSRVEWVVALLLGLLLVISDSESTSTVHPPLGESERTPDLNRTHRCNMRCMRWTCGLRCMARLAWAGLRPLLQAPNKSRADR